MVTPIKKSRKVSPSPGSLLSTLGKIFEKMNNSKIKDNLDDNNSLTEEQFGIRQDNSKYKNYT